MRARVEDAVHVEVEVVKLRQQRGVRDDLVDLRVPLRYPTVEFGNTHGCRLIALCPLANKTNLKSCSVGRLIVLLLLLTPRSTRVNISASSPTADAKVSLNVVS